MTYPQQEIYTEEGDLEGRFGLACLDAKEDDDPASECTDGMQFLESQWISPLLTAEPGPAPFPSISS